MANKKILKLNLIFKKFNLIFKKIKFLKNKKYANVTALHITIIFILTSVLSQAIISP